MPSNYGWRITKVQDPQGQAEIGTTGPHGISDAMVARLVRGEGAPFRMYDGDDELQYEGLFIGPAGPLGEEAFGPLDDFGKPNFGCTEIRYKNKAGAWEVL